jgi:predicted RNA-binding protein with RPS1 domain
MSIRKAIFVNEKVHARIKKIADKEKRSLPNTQPPRYCMRKKQKQTPKQRKHQDIFDFLMDWATHSRRMPKKVSEAVDEVADYVGDIAMGRRK